MTRKGHSRPLRAVCPFVYSTGNTGRKLEGVLRDRPVLTKPFKYEELAETLTRLFSR